jgi:hydroxymethyl cephem carbamoyltransferase
LLPAKMARSRSWKTESCWVSLEAEKDSFPRHLDLNAATILSAAEQIGAFPDVVALSGWSKFASYDRAATLSHEALGAGYTGAKSVVTGEKQFFGRRVRWFSSSHERAHIMMAVGMAPRDEFSTGAVLVWEGALGHFYLLDESCTIVRRIPAMTMPGWRYSLRDAWHRRHGRGK